MLAEQTVEFAKRARRTYSACNISKSLFFKNQYKGLSGLLLQAVEFNLYWKLKMRCETSFPLIAHGWRDSPNSLANALFVPCSCIVVCSAIWPLCAMRGWMGSTLRTANKRAGWHQQQRSDLGPAGGLAVDATACATWRSYVAGSLPIRCHDIKIVASTRLGA